MTVEEKRFPPEFYVTVEAPGTRFHATFYDEPSYRKAIQKVLHARETGGICRLSQACAMFGNSINGLYADGAFCEDRAAVILSEELDAHENRVIDQHSRPGA